MTKSNMIKTKKKENEATPQCELQRDPAVSVYMPKAGSFL